jgi:hypothetical protein
VLGVNIVILNSITWPNEFHFLESLDSSQKMDLNVCWKAIIHAVRIDYVRIEALRLQPNLVRFFIWKSNDLFLNSWTVSWTLTPSLVALELR